MSGYETTNDGISRITFVATGDDEIDAIRACVTILAPLHPKSRQRVLSYVTERYPPSETNPFNALFRPRGPEDEA